MASTLQKLLRLSWEMIDYIFPGELDTLELYETDEVQHMITQRVQSPGTSPGTCTLHAHPPHQPQHIIDKACCARQKDHYQTVTNVEQTVTPKKVIHNMTT